MKEFKQGERVKVEFEALALPESSIAGDNWLFVEITGTQLLTSVRKEHCTLIEPEIVLPEVPGTIVQVDPKDEHGERETYEFIGEERLRGYDEIVPWFSPHNTCTSEELKALGRKYGYRVIPAAEAEGVSE